MRIGLNFLPGALVHGDVTQGSETAELRADIWGTAHETLPVYAGRMLNFAQAVPGGKPQVDGTYALDLLADKDVRTQTFPQDGKIKALTVQPRPQLLGWQSGDYYMLERDANGEIVVEPGQNHRKIHVTMGAHGYTAAEIAAEAGVSVSTITNTWLAANPAWGATPAKALEATLGVAFWKSLLGSGKKRSSIWLLIERGHDYGDLNIKIPYASRGESALHPLYIGPYGTGTLPKSLAGDIDGWTPENIVYRDLGDASIGISNGRNILLSGIENNDVGLGRKVTGLAAGITYHRCMILDCTASAPNDGMTYWGERSPHVGGFYTTMNYGLLFEENFWDHNGWADGYDPNGAWNNGQYPMPPNSLSHNVYIQWDNRCVGMFDNFSLRSSSMGWMLRPGGYCLGNISADNNIAANDLGGDYKSQGPVGEYSIWQGNVGISAGYKVRAGSNAVDWGFDITGRLLTSFDNVVMHRADPNNPAEVKPRHTPYSALKYTGAGPRGYIKDISYNWAAHGDPSQDTNIEGLNTTTLNNTTLQKWIGAQLGKASGTITELGTYFRSLPKTQRSQKIHELRRYLQTPFASKLETDWHAVRSVAVASTFKPDGRCEGFRWDMPINWTSGVIPGEVAGDTVNLFGNRVKFLRFTTAINSITFADGLLEVSSGKLTAAAHADAAKVKVFNCGQYFAPGGTGDYEARSGRLAFTAAAIVGIEASGDAEVLFGPSLTIPAGKTLRLQGGQGFFGWDGTGSATLTINGTLSLRSTPIIVTDAMDYRFDQGYPIKGETSNFSGLLDITTRPFSSANNWLVAVRDASGTPTLGEVVVDEPLAFGESTGEDGEGSSTTYISPIVTAILPATMPKLGKFKRRGDDPNPTVNVTVALSGPLRLDLTGIVAGTYTLVEANSITGNFSSQTINGLAAGLKATVNKTATTVEVVVAAA